MFSLSYLLGGLAIVLLFLVTVCPRRVITNFLKLVTSEVQNLVDEAESWVSQIKCCPFLVSF